LPALTFSTGDLVGQYRLEAHLGGGGFGSVWRAANVDSGQIVAVKLLTAAESAEVRGEIELLAATASSASPHVVRVLGGGTEPIPYIVMEYVEGSDLAELLTERGRLPITEVLDVGLALADALGALEKAGIVHRDVKPGNVLVDKQGTIRLADFGIAKIAGYATVTTTRQAPLTMAYAAPEVWQGHATHQSDLYAFGCVLFQCLVGTPPFVAGIGELYVKHMNETPNLDVLPPSAPASLRDLIRRCLAKAPAERPLTANDCVAMLKRAFVEANEAASAVTTSSEPAKFGPWLRRTPRPDRPWAWDCVHESSGDPAIVEVYAFGTLDEGNVLRRAVEASPALAPLGAEPILGYNRLLLRPGEAWLEAPDGEFQFWVARAAAVSASADAPVSVDTLNHALARLQSLTAATLVAGLTLDLARHRLRFDGTGIVVERVGLPSEPGEGLTLMQWIRSLPLDEEAAKAAAAASTIDDLAAALVVAGNRPAIGVADAVFETQNLVSEPGESAFFTIPPVADATIVAQPETTPEAAPGAPPVTVAPGEPPRRRRRALVGLGLFAGSGVALAAFGFFLTGSNDPIKAGSTASPTVVPLEIKSVDCSPSTVEVGAPVACDALLSVDATELTFTWSAEDGAPASGAAAKFPVVFSVAGAKKKVDLKVCKGDACVEKTAFVSVNDAGAGPPPEAAFECVPSPVRAGESLRCAALIVGEGITWGWDAPSGQPATGTESALQTTFSKGGIQDVTLTICRTLGGKKACATSKQPVPVQADASIPQPTSATHGGNNAAPSPVPPPAVASFNCSPSTLRLNEQLTCSATAVGKEDSRSWLASGGNPASGTSSGFTTSFATAGPKSIVLQLCNSTGCTTDSRSVFVNDVPPPQVTISCSPGSVAMNAPVACSVNVGSGTVSSYFWNAPLGNPSTSSSSSFVTSYNVAGSKTISLNACSGVACSSASYSITVESPATPTASPTQPPTNTPVPTNTAVPPGVTPPTPTSAPIPPTATPILPTPTSTTAAAPPPTVGSLGCTPSAVQVNSLVSCTPAVSGTTLSTTYSWGAAQAYPGSGTAPSFSTRFQNAGTLSISLTVCNGPSAASCASSSMPISVSMIALPCGTNSLSITFFSTVSFVTSVSTDCKSYPNGFGEFVPGGSYQTGPGGRNYLQSNYSIRWEGWIYYQPGSHHCFVTSDDGARLYLDGEVLIDDWGPHSNQRRDTSFNIPIAGWHLFDVDYWQGGGDAQIGGGCDQ
jgi:hypothetical protein